MTTTPRPCTPILCDLSQMSQANINPDTEESKTTTLPPPARLQRQETMCVQPSKKRKADTEAVSPMPVVDLTGDDTDTDSDYSCCDCDELVDTIDMDYTEFAAAVAEGTLWKWHYEPILYLPGRILRWWGFICDCEEPLQSQRKRCECGELMYCTKCMSWTLTATAEAEPEPTCAASQGSSVSVAPVPGAMTVDEALALFMNE